MAASPPGDTFTAFYERTFDRLVGSLRNLAGADAADVAQEALLVARGRWDTVSGFDKPEAWVRHVARRMALRRALRDRERTRREANAAEIGPGRHALAPWPTADLDLLAAIRLLSERQAAAIRLYHLEGRSVDEVAARLGCTDGAAKVLLHRARRLLAERLSGLSARWVAEQTWTPDAIRRRLVETRHAADVGTILDIDFGGRGGRWELTIEDGSYALLRDDGRRFDHGNSRVIGRTLELAPILNPGRARYVPTVDGRRLSLRLLDTSIPPHLGVSDEVWIDVIYGATTFVRQT